MTRFGRFIGCRGVIDTNVWVAALLIRVGIPLRCDRKENNIPCTVRGGGAYLAI